MLELMAMSYVVSVCLYLGQLITENRIWKKNTFILSNLGVSPNDTEVDLDKWYAEADKIQELVDD